jgi:hypothetical protein
MLTHIAFCYYLPDLLASSLRELRWDCNAYDSLIGTLDRGPERDNWHDLAFASWAILLKP